MTPHAPPSDAATPAAGAFAWPGRADFARLFKLAIPVVIVQVGLMAMGVVDIIMVGHYSARDLAATALGNVYSFGVIAFGMGVLMALDPVVAQAFGAGDERAIGRAIQRGLLLSVILTIPTALLMWPARHALLAFGQPDEIVPLAARFVHLSIPGILPFFGFVVLRQSLQAMGHMRPIVVVMLAANVVNALLCGIFVFGLYGVPWHGTEGAGVSTMLSRWAMWIGLLVFAWKDLEPSLRPLRRQAFALAPLLRTIRLGTPIGVQFILEFGVFGVVALLMGHLGTVPMAAHQVAINIASFTFMVPLGVSSAAAVVVGQSVGAGDPGGARRGAVAALFTGVAFMMMSGLTLALAPRFLAGVYTSDAAVAALAALLIPLAGLFQVFDGLQVVSVGILRGVGDTRAPMVVNVLGFWLIGFPISLWLGFRTGLGAPGLWWGLVAGLTAVALFLVLRVRHRMNRDLRRLAIEEEEFVTG